MRLINQIRLSNKIPTTTRCSLPSPYLPTLPASLPPIPPSTPGMSHRRGPSMQERRASVAQGLASRASRQQLVRKGIVLNLSANERRIRELDAEVAALKGELEQQAANHSRDLRDQLSSAEKTAREANLEFASQARGIHVMREKFLKEKKNL